MENLRYFFEPKNVAIIGVSTKAAGFSWGRGVFKNLISANSDRKIYPIHPEAKEIDGIKAYPSLSDVPEKIDLAVITVPVGLVPQTLNECIKNEIKSVVLVTAGYAETSQGKELQNDLTSLARESGLLIVGPNVSGVFNVTASLNASILNSAYLKDTPIAFICQGGYAIHDLIYRNHNRGLAIGKFLHTGNESNVTCTDFLEYLGTDPSVKVILMYIEGLRNGRRFIDVAKELTKNKPVIVFKSGGTEAGSRAASSHTGAISGSDTIFNAAMSQANVIRSPKMELMMSLGHAFLELPPLRGKRIGVISMGGSWGVIITDALNRAGLDAPEFSEKLQKQFHNLGMPYWASTRNPIDLGASGAFMWSGGATNIIEGLLASDEVDAVLIHGFGQTKFIMGEDSSSIPDDFDVEADMIKSGVELMSKYNKPVLICSYYPENESSTIDKAIKNGCRIYNEVDDAAIILKSLYTYYSNKNRFPANN